MRKTVANRLVYLSFLVFLGIPAARAQGTGTIHGAVSDASAAGVPNAKVTALLGERGATRTVATDSAGGSAFPELPLGTYSIRVEVAGFKTFVLTGVELTANANARVDATMEVG